MKHRTSRGLAAITLVSALLLSGCSNGDDTGTDATPSGTPSSTPSPEGAPESSPEDIEALKTVKVTGDVGTEPTLEIKTPFSVTTPVVSLDTDGTGDDLKEGELLSMQAVSYDGADGTLLSSTWDANPSSIVLGDTLIFPQLNEILTGRKIGTRFLFAAPTQQQDGTTKTIVSVIEIVGAQTVLKKAEGEAVAPVDGLPVVTLDGTGKPSIDIPKDYKAPTKLLVQPLIKGDGPALANGQAVTVNYTGWTLDGESFDSSWEKGQTLNIPALGAGRVIQGWDQGLVGQTVGSQVLLVIPPELAYGPTADPSSPLAGKPLVFVVDILAAA